jgi:hypothetical protein
MPRPQACIGTLHQQRDPWERPGGTTFHFVNDGIHSALVAGRRAGRRIGVEHLPPEYLARGARRQLASLEQTEALAIMNALRAAGGNKNKAALGLGIARSTLYRKVRALVSTSRPPSTDHRAGRTAAARAAGGQRGRPAIVTAADLWVPRNPVSSCDLDVFVPGCPDRGTDDADVGAGEDRVEGRGELAVSVTHQEPEPVGAVAGVWLGVPVS